jgi:hypothetical protein
MPHWLPAVLGAGHQSLKHWLRFSRFFCCLASETTYCMRSLSLYESSGVASCSRFPGGGRIPEFDNQTQGLLFHFAGKETN